MDDLAEERIKTGMPVFAKVSGQRFPQAGLLLFALLLLLAGCMVGRSSNSQETAGSANFIPIGKEFRSFYETNGGQRVFGYPLTDPFPNVSGDRIIQYFQRMKLEYDPARDDIHISALGEWDAPSGSAEYQASSDPLLTEGAFLTFYEKYNGELLFGRPITPQIDEAGMRIQYFDNARLEWHPELPLDYRVQVGLLGEAHYRQVGLYMNPGRSRPLDSATVREAIISVNFRAPIMYSGDSQVIFVQVQTPEGHRPVTGVKIELAVSYDGRTELIELIETDGAGYTQGDLVLHNVTPGQKVKVLVTASAPGGPTIGTTSQSFRTWW